MYKIKSRLTFSQKRHCDAVSSFLGHRVTQCFSQGYTVNQLCDTLCPPFLGHRVTQCFAQGYTVKNTL